MGTPRVAGRGAATVGGRGAARSSGATVPAAADVRVAAVRLLERLLAGEGSLTRLLPEAQAALPAAERALLQACAFGLARWSGQLSALLGRLLERPLKAKDRDLHLLLQLGLFQLLHTRTAPHAAVDAAVEATRRLDKPWARGLVNAVLRNALRRRESLLADLDEAERSSHPDWLLARLRADWPGRWREICEANNRQAPMVLRVNLARTSVAACRERLAAAGIDAAPLDGVPAALELARPLGVDALPGFADGALSVQDGAAQLAVALLAAAVPRGTRLLDACAAPGGKTAQALESGAFGDVLALDSDAERLERARETLARLGLGARATLLAADATDPAPWWDGVPFGAVLLDAPCTGTGVIRRHPDIKLLRRERDVAPLVARQARLLDALWPTLAPGGALLYATCSVLRDEGERQVAAFLERRVDAALALERRLLPGEGGASGAGGMDGFYHALLVRAS